MKIEQYLQTGIHDHFKWMECGLATVERSDVLAACPEVVVGKRLVVAVLGGSPFRPNDLEVAQGWRLRGNMAVHPRIISVDQVPQAYDDEFWILTDDRAPLPPGVVAGFSGFSLTGNDVHCDQGAVECMQSFGREIRTVNPESFLEESEALNFITRDMSLFARVVSAARRSVEEKLRAP